MAATPTVFLGLGANVGDPLARHPVLGLTAAEMRRRGPDRSPAVPYERSLPR